MQRTWIVGVFVVGLVFPGQATAQEETASEVPMALFASAGGGWGSGDLAERGFVDGTLVYAAFTADFGTYDVSLRYAEVTEFGDASYRGYSVNDLALLYGVHLPFSTGWFRGAVGPSFTRLDYWGAGSGVGFAAQLDLVVASAPGRGFGFALLGNLNARRSFMGAIFSVHVGDVRVR